MLLLLVLCGGERMGREGSEWMAGAVVVGSQGVGGGGGWEWTGVGALK